MLNKFYLYGRLVQNVELKVSKNNKNYVKSAISVLRPGAPKDDKGQYITDLYYFVAFDKTAEHMAKNCVKGDIMILEGLIRKNIYQIEIIEQENGNYVPKKKEISNYDLTVTEYTRIPNKFNFSTDSDIKQKSAFNDLEDAEVADSNKDILARYAEVKATKETNPDLFIPEEDTFFGDEPLDI